MYQLKIGITGSIGMGKTTIAKEIGKHEYPVWNADSVVHKLYRKQNSGYNIIKSLVPESAELEGINRNILSQFIAKQPSLLMEIKKAIYPLIEKDRSNFVQRNKDAKLLIFDIPLLFETACDKWLDKVIVATAPFAVQKRRVLSRKFMTEEKFKYLLKQQWSNEKKINRADFVLNTNISFKRLETKITNLLAEILNSYD